MWACAGRRRVRGRGRAEPRARLVWSVALVRESGTPGARARRRDSANEPGQQCRAARRAPPPAPRQASASCAVQGAIVVSVAALQRGVPLRQRGRIVGASELDRAGSRRPSVRSKYARRAAGPALTIASRSGVKTSVADSRAKLLGRPQARAVHLGPFPLGRGQADADPHRRVVPGARRARSAQTVSPKRISSASERVRGENPWVPTCSDSSRFVLPAPFAPTARTSPGSRDSSSRA